MRSQTEAINYNIHKERYDEAESSCRILIGRYKNDPSFMKQAGNIVGQYDKRGFLTKAEILCQAALQAQPEHKDAIVFKKHLVRICLDQNDYAKAKALLNEFISSYKSHPSYFRQAYSIGWDFQKHNQYSMALELYEQLLADFPDHKEIGRIPYYQARAYLESGQIDQSLERVQACFSQYINWKPMARKMLETGCLYGRLGHSEYAQEILKKVLNDHSKKLVGSDLAMAFVHLDQDAKVQEQINLILASDRPLSKKHQFLLEISHEYHSLAHWAKIIDASEENIRMAENKIAVLEIITNGKASRHSAEALYSVGVTHWGQHAYHNALDAFLRLADRYPGYKNTAEALKYSADCYTKLYDQRAISAEVFEEGLETVLLNMASSEALESVNEYVWTVAQLKYKNEKWKDAIRYLELCQDYTSNSLSSEKRCKLNYQLAKAYEESGDTQSALQYYVSYLDNVQTDDPQHVVAIQKKIRQLQRK